MKIIFLLFIALNNFVFSQDLIEFKFNTNEQAKLNIKSSHIANYSDSKNGYSGKDEIKVIETCIELKEYGCLINRQYDFFEEIDSGNIKKSKKIADTTTVQDSQGKEILVKDDPIKTVMSVPYFPKNKIDVGDIWTGQGILKYDNLFDTNQKINEKINVEYEYLDKKVIDGRNIAVISIVWNKEVVFNKVSNKKIQITNLTTDSYGELLFDIDRGRPYSYHYDYNVIVVFNTGNSVNIESTSITTIEYIDIGKNKNLISEVEKDLESINTTIKEKEGHIFMSVSDINFDVNSFKINEETQKRLNIIGEILKKYTGRSVIIKGHTSYENYGTEKEHQVLSELRAKSVTDFLINNNFVKKADISYQGVGHSEPLVPNNSPQNILKNRRIEIIVQ